MRYYNNFFAVLKLYFWSIHMTKNLILAISFGFKLSSNLNKGKRSICMYAKAVVIVEAIGKSKMPSAIVSFTRAVLFSWPTKFTEPSWGEDITWTPPNWVSREIHIHARVQFITKKNNLKVIVICHRMRRAILGSRKLHRFFCTITSCSEKNQLNLYFPFAKNY